MAGYCNDDDASFCDTRSHANSHPLLRGDVSLDAYPRKEHPDDGCIWLCETTRQQQHMKDGVAVCWSHFGSGCPGKSQAYRLNGRSSATAARRPPSTSDALNLAEDLVEMSSAELECAEILNKRGIRDDRLCVEFFTQRGVDDLVARALE